jgi:hypothetical protein
MTLVRQGVQLETDLRRQSVSDAKTSSFRIFRYLGSSRTVSGWIHQVVCTTMEVKNCDLRFCFMHNSLVLLSVCPSFLRHTLRTVSSPFRCHRQQLWFFVFGGYFIWALYSFNSLKKSLANVDFFWWIQCHIADPHPFRNWKAIQTKFLHRSN